MELESAGNESLVKFFGCCPNLINFTLSGDYWSLADEDVGVIVERCPLLYKLCLMGLSEITDLSLSYISSLVNLVELDISSLEIIDTDSSGMTSDGLQSLVKARPSIQVLKCNIEEGDVDSFLECVGTHCTHLRVLVVETGEEIAGAEHAAVIALVQGCPLLEELDIDEYSPNDDVLYTLSEHCPRLKRIDTYKYESAAFTDLGLIAMSRGCPDLTQLHLHDAPDIADATILSFAEHCHKLDSFALSNNQLITSPAMCALLKANPGITAIEVTSCTLIDDKLILAIAQHCPKVKLLRVLGCQRSSAESLYTLARGCRSLVDIFIVNSTITDAFVDILTHHCMRLRTIYLSDCPNITERTLATLLESGKHLTSIVISFCALYVNDTLYQFGICKPRPASISRTLQRGLSWLYHSIYEWIIRPARRDLRVSSFIRLSRAHRRAPWELVWCS